MNHPASISNPHGSSVKTTIPALRAVFNCTAVPHKSIIHQNNVAEGILSFELTEVDARTCDNTILTQSYNPLAMGYTDVSGVSYQISDYCPAFLYAVALLDSHNNTHPLRAFNMAQCFPYLEQLDTQVTFNLPHFTVDTSKPPWPVVSSSRIVINDISSASGSQLPLTNYLTSYQIGQYYLPSLGDAKEATGLQPLTQALVYSVHGTPLAELVQSDGGSTLAGSLDRVFGVTMAQLLSAYGRSASPTNSSFPRQLGNFNAMLMEPESLRLAQSTISTRILQGLLAAMAFCAVITTLTLSTKGVLPKDPRSIASLASLLVGSEFLKKIPPGSEWLNEKQLLELFDGWLFSIRWWEVDGQYRFGIDVGQHPGKDLEDLTRLDRNKAIQVPAANAADAPTLIDGIGPHDNSGGSASNDDNSFEVSVRQSLDRIFRESHLE